MRWNLIHSASSMSDEEDNADAIIPPLALEIALSGSTMPQIVKKRKSITNADTNMIIEESPEDDKKKSKRRVGHVFDLIFLGGPGIYTSVFDIFFKVFFFNSLFLLIRNCSCIKHDGNFRRVRCRPLSSPF